MAKFAYSELNLMVLITAKLLYIIDIRNFLNIFLLTF